eukprot:SAG22_NODE_101_length_20519_cov_15.588002_14_plen_79_part_00
MIVLLLCLCRFRADRKLRRRPTCALLAAAALSCAAGGRGTRRDSQLPGGWYSNMTMSYNGCLGHGGFGGQYMLADPVR